MADDHALWSQADLPHDQSNDLLSFVDRRTVDLLTESGEEALEVLGQGQVGLVVKELRVERVELRAQRRLLPAQLGHPGSELVEGKQTLLVGLEEPGHGRARAGELELETVALSLGRVGGPQLRQAPIQLGGDQGPVGQQGCHVSPDQVVELVLADRAGVAAGASLVAPAVRSHL